MFRLELNNSPHLQLTTIPLLPFTVIYDKCIIVVIGLNSITITTAAGHPLIRFYCPYVVTSVKDIRRFASVT